MAETLTQGAGSFLLKQSTPINRPFWFGTTAQTVTVTISKNGAAFGATTNNPTEIANGWYNIQLSAADTSLLGLLAFHASSAVSGGPADWCDQVVLQLYSDLSLNNSNQVNVSSNAKQNAALLLPFTMTSTASGAPLTGLAGSITVQRNFGVGWTPCAGAITELGFGDYTIALAAADTNSPTAVYRMTASPANDVNIVMIFQP